MLSDVCGVKNKSIDQSKIIPTVPKRWEPSPGYHPPMQSRIMRVVPSGIASVELTEEGLEVLADDAVEDPMLRSATHVRSRNRLARSRGVKVHDHRTPSRLVPLSAPTFSTCLR